MVDLGIPNKCGKWVCPNDRQLALRAKLKTGWSVKTQDLQDYNKKPQALNEKEQNIIKQVIQRAEMLEQKEQERVGRLVDRLDNMKRNVMGNGTTQCILCGDNFGIFGTSNFVCNDCKKLVCEKCGVEIVSATQDSMWLCKICSETREMWKKSGAWFFKSLPKYKLPEKKAERFGPQKFNRPRLAKSNWSKVSIDSSASSNGELNKTGADEETSSEEERKVNFRVKKQSDEQVKTIQGNSTTSNVFHLEKVPKSPGTISTASGSFSNDSSMGESEKNLGIDKEAGQKKIYCRKVSNDSSESNNSTFSRQTSSVFSESQTNLTSSTTYLSSINQSCERLSLNNEQNRPDPINQRSDRSPTPNTSPSCNKSLILNDKSAFGKSEKEKSAAGFDSTINDYERHGRKLPTPGYRNPKMEYNERKNVDSQKHRKKVSIDFGRATAFLRHPLKADKKKELKTVERNSSETSLVSPTDIDHDSQGKFGRCWSGNIDYCYESERTKHEDTKSNMGANHWMSQESGMNVAESDDLNFRLNWRESLSSLSRDYCWTDDQISLSSFLSLNPYDTSDTVVNQSAQLGLLELSAWYDQIRTCLHCVVHRAKDLRGTEDSGFLDPFCKLNIIPTVGKSGYLKTKTVHRSINPEFNETVTFYEVTNVDMQRKILHILVLNDNKSGEYFLGEIKIPLHKIARQHFKNIKVSLEKHYQIDEDESTWSVKGWHRTKYEN